MELPGWRAEGESPIPLIVGIVLAGTELRTETLDCHSQTREHRQLWLCVPVERQGLE
jgi:hypothetical protein